MVEKRKDSKGRRLFQGESQRKDGRYCYTYIDTLGVRRSCYSWMLTDTDKLPAGKRGTESLRAAEKRIKKDLSDGITTNRKTLNRCATIRKKIILIFIKSLLKKV